MRIDFNQIQEMTMPCLHGGPGEMSARFFGGEGGKLISCRIHPTSDDVNFVLLGTGLVVCDGQEEPLEPGVCHICKKGSEHSIQNTGEGDLVLLTLVVERGEGRENDT